MADKSAKSPRKTATATATAAAHTVKTVRSQNILANQSSAGERPSRADESGESDDEPQPLPRSHTPGHLASKSINDRRRKPSDLAIRQRSQSASQVSSTSPGAATATGHQASKPPPPPPPPPPPTPAPAPVSTNPGATPAPTAPTSTSAADVEKDGGEAEQKKPASGRASSSAAASRSTLPTSASSRSAAAAAAAPRITRPPRGQHVPFPAIRGPEDGPEVEPAPPSGMYWSKAPVSGSPHSNLRAHTTTIIGSNIYVFGGCDSRTCFNSMYVLDADAFYWSVPHMVGEMPMPLRAMTCTAVGKKLVVFGGGDGPAYHNDVYVLDTVNFRWYKPRIVGDKMPSKRRAHTACLYKNGIYVFGGGDGVRALNDIWRLDVSDPTKMSWRLISSVDKTPAGTRDVRPRPRGYHTANMVGSKLIVYGGSDGGECFDDVWIYDVERHVWKAVPISVTFRRLSHTATIVGSYLFVIGGHDGTEYCNDVLLLNLVTMTWNKRRVYGRPPSGRGYHGTVLHDSRLIVIGGFDGSDVFGDVSILELAVHAYYSQISHFTIDV